MGAGRSALESARKWFITGAALTIPLIITLIVLGFVLNFVSNTLTPVVSAVRLVGLDGLAAAFGRMTSLGEDVSPLLMR